MLIDYITGIVVAGVFKKSKKSQGGAIESRVGYGGDGAGHVAVVGGITDYLANEVISK